MRRWFAIISGIIFAFGTGISLSESTRPGADGDRRGIYMFSMQAPAIASELKLYYKSHGCYPTNSEGFSPITSSFKAKAKKINGYLSSCRITPSGILSWWGDPLIYENRQGQSLHRFNWSGAKDGVDHNYSYKVDNGIYIWSVGARSASYREDSRKRRAIAILAVTLIISGVFLALYVFDALDKLRNPTRFKKALCFIGYLLWGIFIIMIISIPIQLAVCIRAFPSMQIQRTPKLTQEYVKTMRSYRDHGIISNDSLTEIISNLERDEKDSVYSRYKVYQMP